MNTFELKIVILPPDEAQGGVPCVTPEIWVDGHHLDEPLSVDLCRLVGSVFSPKPFYVLTCGCGDPGCAEIWEGFGVRHEPGKIRWRFRRPVSAGDVPIQDLHERIRYWREHTTIVEYEFDREAFCSALQNALDTVLACPSDAEFSPYGTDRKTLAALSLRKHPPAWNEAPGWRHLYFLADEEHPWFLEGQFVSPDSLGLVESSLKAFKAWQLRGQRDRLDPDTRIAWLEEGRQLLLSTYVKGLPADIDLKLVAQLRAKSGGLNPWSVDIRDLKRRLLDMDAPLEAPYLCLSADQYGFELWLDDTPEAKSDRSCFVGSGAKVHESILVPFQLERELYAWACQLPGSTGDADDDPVALWDLDEPHALRRAEIGNWAEFHQQGRQLAAKLQTIVGQRAMVLYEMPWGAPDTGAQRRYASTD